MIMIFMPQALVFLNPINIKPYLHSPDASDLKDSLVTANTMQQAGFLCHIQWKWHLNTSRETGC